MSKPRGRNSQPTSASTSPAREPPAKDDQPESRTCSLPCKETLAQVEQHIRDIEAFTVATPEGRKVESLWVGEDLTQSYQRTVETLAALHDALVRRHAVRVENHVSPAVVYKASAAVGGEGGMDRVLASGVTGLMFAMAWPPDVPGWIERDGTTKQRPRFQFGDVITTASWNSIQSNALALKAHVDRAHGQTVAPKGTAIRETAVPKASVREHGIDFTWVVVHGHRFEFKKGNQAEAIRCLWGEAERAGFRPGCGMSEGSIASEVSDAERSFSMRHLFRGHAALHTFLRRVGKGTWALYFEHDLMKKHR